MLCTNLVLIASILGADPQYTVSVEIKNISLPICVEWQTEDDSLKGKIAHTSVGKMPAGSIKACVKPVFVGYHFAPVRYRVNDGKPSDVMISPHHFVLRDKDVLTIECQAIIPTWYSTIVEIRGKPVLVCLALPLAQLGLEKWEKGEGGAEEFPNAIFFIARYGVDEMAMRVARGICTRKRKPNTCTDHIAALPFIGKPLSEDEIRDAVADGLRALMQKCSPNGPSIGHEVEEARSLLLKGRGRKPESK